MRNKIPSLKELVIFRPACGLILAYVFMQYFSAQNPSAAMLSVAVVVVYLETLRKLKSHGYLKSHPDPKLVRKLNNLCPACDGDGPKAFDDRSLRSCGTRSTTSQRRSPRCSCRRRIPPRSRGRCIRPGSSRWCSRRATARRGSTRSPRCAFARRRGRRAGRPHRHPLRRLRPQMHLDWKRMNRSEWIAVAGGLLDAVAFSCVNASKGMHGSALHEQRDGIYATSSASCSAGRCSTRRPGPAYRRSAETELRAADPPGALAR